MMERTLSTDLNGKEYNYICMIYSSLFIDTPRPM